MSSLLQTTEITLRTRGDTDIHDVTDAVAELIGTAGLREGQVLIFVPGSTGGLTTVEHEPGLLKDLPAAFERLYPKAMRYHHDETWHDGNGHSHVRAAMLGPSLTVPVLDGRMTLGTWQQIVFIDFDNRPRQRHLVVQLTGNT